MLNQAPAGMSSSAALCFTVEMPNGELSVEGTSENVMNILIGIFLILFVSAAWKFVVNYLSLRRVSALMVEHREYLKEMAAENTDGPGWEFPEKVPEIKALFERAEIVGGGETYMEPAGFGYATKKHINYLDNMTVNNAQIQRVVVAYFHEAVGVYRYRMKEALSVRYWVEEILHLPSHVMKYIGFSESSPLPRFLDALSWVFIILGFLISLPDFVWLRDAISNWVGMVVSKIIGA